MVELMVGITIGLFVVAAASMMMASQLNENRRLLLETQLQQDLRATADIMTRELRRASYFSETANHIWYDGKSGPAIQNAYGELTPVSGAGLSEFSFKYRRRSGDEGPFGFKLEGNEIKSRIAGQWQVLTDSRVMVVTAFDVDLAAPVTYPLPCPRLCSDGTQDCWPELQVRTAAISLTGQSVSDPSIVRTLNTQVRLRNDFTKFNGASVCPD
jgi:type IV pilus assembly protein PilW